MNEPIYLGLLQSDLDCAGFDLLNVSGGSGGGGAVTQLVNGKSYITVTFDEVQEDDTWKFTQLVVGNTVDSGPLNIAVGTLTAKSATGFTLQLIGEPDSSNYFLHWGFTGTGGGTGSTPLSPLPDGATVSELLSSTPIARTPIASLATSLGNYFDSQTFDPCVLVNPTDSSQLIMFFSGMAAPLETGTQSIGRATASIADPTVWTVSASPVLTMTLGWESGAGVRADSVVYNPADAKIYLFYTGGYSVGVASSSDLGLTWTKLGEVLVTSGDEITVSQMSVLLEGSTLHAIYAYRTASATLAAYRYASASTSNWLSWTKGGVDVYSDPETVSLSLFQEFHQLFKIDSTYLLAYEVNNLASINGEIRFATSSSPSSGWVVSPVTPFLEKSGIAGTFDEFHVATPHFMVINGYWYLIYCGALDHGYPYGTNHWQMGIAPLGT